jgi:hypothetical protein
MGYEGFVNLTPFAAGPYLLADESGADVLTFVVKASYAIEGPTSLSLAEKQEEIVTAPEYYEDADASSVKYESEVYFVKPATDVVLIGHAFSTSYDREQVDVSLTVGPVRKTVRVFGNRYWSRGVAGHSPSRPEPFEQIPLRYENAFGGWYRTGEDPSLHTFEPRNPVGRGFVPEKHQGIPDDLAVPNLENPTELVGSPTDRPTPAGFGFIAPGWPPRMSYAGTYDDAWQQERMPLLPKDFNRLYFNGAPPDLMVRGFLHGGEPVEVTNASQMGTLRFHLPVLWPEAVAMFKDGTRHAADMLLDTVVINTDENLVFLVWRTHVNVQGRIHDVVWAKTQLKQMSTP